MTLVADMCSCGEAEEELLAVQEIKQRLFPKDGSTELNGKFPQNQCVSILQTVCNLRLIDAVTVAMHSMDTVWECTVVVRIRGKETFGVHFKTNQSNTTQE